MSSDRFPVSPRGKNSYGRWSWFPEQETLWLYQDSYYQVDDHPCVLECTGLVAAAHKWKCTPCLPARGGGLAQKKGGKSNHPDKPQTTPEKRGAKPNGKHPKEGNSLTAHRPAAGRARCFRFVGEWQSGSKWPRQTSPLAMPEAVESA